MTSLLDLIFPKKCLGCSRTGAYFCSSCQKEIKVWPVQICPVCQRSAIHGLTHPKCQNKYRPDSLISVFVYQGLIKEAIKKLKYKPWRYHLAEELTTLTTQNLPPNFLNLLNSPIPSLLVPIPLHWFRQNWRGFNQATLLGKYLAKKLKIKFLPDLLYRLRYTQPQTKLTKDKRQENIQGAFKIHPKYPLKFPKHPKLPNILLFDDVWTTGATMTECSRVLKKSGFPKVFCLTLAR